MRHNHLISSCILLLSGILFSNFSLALQTDRKQPIKIEAGKASIEKKTGISTYSNNVMVRQGSMRITADKITIYTREGKLVKMTALGKPTTFQQKTNNKNKSIDASAMKMTFHANSNIAIFENNAVLKQGGNTFTSNRIVYNIGKDQVNAGKKSGGDRVTITIQPAEQKPNMPAQ